MVMPMRGVQKSHRDEGQAMYFVNLVDGTNVCVVQGRGGLGFALKAGEDLSESVRAMWRDS